MNVFTYVWDLSRMNSNKFSSGLAVVGRIKGLTWFPPETHRSVYHDKTI